MVEEDEKAGCTVMADHRFRDGARARLDRSRNDDAYHQLDRSLSMLGQRYS